MMIVAGVDEAGRGPLFGPVVAAAVVLNEEIDGLDDSKKITSRKREKLFLEIIKKSYFAISIATADEIDKFNILHATEIAMDRALERLKKKIDFDIAFVDGKNLNLKFPFKCIVKGDSLVKEISAASILAKVVRDRIIVSYAKKFSSYMLEKHKGYPTQLHLKLIKEHGLTPLHRLTYKPVMELLSITQLEEWYKSGMIDEERYKKIISKMEVPLFGIQDTR